MSLPKKLTWYHLNICDLVIVTQTPLLFDRYCGLNSYFSHIVLSSLYKNTSYHPLLIIPLKKKKILVDHVLSLIEEITLDTKSNLCHAAPIPSFMPSFSIFNLCPAEMKSHRSNLIYWGGRRLICELVAPTFGRRNEIY